MKLEEISIDKAYGDLNVICASLRLQLDKKVEWMIFRRTAFVFAVEEYVAIASFGQSNGPFYQMGVDVENDP